MDTEAALLRAICANPDEDTPRLALADYLDESGNADRAAFVRGQVELATLTEDSMHRREVAFRCRQLLDANEDEWLDPREAFERDWGWSRGFVETLSTTPGDLSYAHDGLFHKYPVRRLWLWELEGNIDGVSLIPEDNRLTALDLIGNNLNVKQLKKLAKMTHLPHLRELGLMFNDLRDTAVKVLCGEPFFQRLELIRLGANPFTERGRDQLRAHFGECVTFAHEREPDRLYTLMDNYYPEVGWGNEFTQILLLRDGTGERAALFDHAGNLLQTLRQPEPRSVNTPSKPGQWLKERDEWRARLGYHRRSIKVKAFRDSGGLEITPFNWWAEAYDDLNHSHRVSRSQLNEFMGHWLESGSHSFGNADNVERFDRSGIICDT